MATYHFPSYWSWYAVAILACLLDHVAARGPCDPLVPEYCLLPFPNSFYTKQDPSTETGIKINLSSDSIPRYEWGTRVNPRDWNSFDGFSPFPSIVTYFPNLDDSNLPPHWDMAQSMSDVAPTILMEVATGSRLPHFAELDSSLLDAQYDKKALMIWPSKRLKDNAQYIVALRFLRTKDGELVQPSPSFKALRDNLPTNDSDIEERRTDFENMFDSLKIVGVQRDSLQLVWDFTTASRDFLTGRLVSARDDALARVGLRGPRYTIEQVFDSYSKSIYRKISGIMMVPTYLNTPLPGSHLVLDDNGLPVYQQLSEATFTVLVPHSVANGSLSPARVLQYGHGLFGSQSEVETGYLQDQANQYGYVLAACDWWGMSDVDLPFVAAMLGTDLSDFRIVPDRLTQGVVNFLLLMRLMKGGLSKDPMMVFDGRPAIDSTKVNYYGNSQGGIFGEVYMAATTDVTRGTLGVAGGPFGLLLPRSKDFAVYETELRLAYPDPVDFVTVISVINMGWSRLEPSGYMSSITSDPLPNTPKHQILYHYALGDAQVNLLGTYSIARSAGAIMYDSNVRARFALPKGDVITESLFGLDLVEDGTILSDQSVVMGFDCQVPPEPSTNYPPDSDTDTHERPRRTSYAHRQMDLFMRTGEVTNVCNGPCNDCS